MNARGSAGGGAPRPSRIVQVAPLLRLRGLGASGYDYRTPDDWPEVPGVGDLVRAPFGRRVVAGVVVARGASGEVAEDAIAPLRARLDDRVPDDLLDLARFLSEHYLAPLGACLRAVVPPHVLAGTPGARARRIAWARPTGDCPETLTPRQREVLSGVPAEGAPITAVTRRLGTTRVLLNALAEAGCLRIEERPAEAAEASEASLESKAGAGHAQEAGVVAPADPLELTEEQRQVLERLEALSTRGGFAHAVLWGVTGSGKTEVYLRLAESVLAGGRSVLVLVPEIALAPQTLARFQGRFPGRVAVLHSALAAGRRADEYRRISSGEATVVIGARSAVTAPLADLGLVVVDESQETSYKQEEEPRYDARTVARWRMERAGGLLVEGSATPRLESLIEGRPVLRLRERPAGATLPRVELVDLRRQGGSGTLSPPVRRALKETMEAGAQAIVLLNRRGYAGYLQCPACGEVVMCDRCEITLTYFRREGELRCHHCGRRASAPSVCPACEEASLERRSPGTERLGDELRSLVPRTGLFRLDSDTVTSATRLEELLGRFAATRPAVLVGTQMVAKGHDFPDVTTVVVADADTGLYLPDFRAAERTFQLLTQVAGRAGRRAAPGRVLVQTWNPEVGCIRMALDQRGEAFYREEAALRRRLGYPPYRRLVRLVLSGRDEDRVRRAGEYLAERLEGRLPRGELRGPARLPVLRGRARWHLLAALEPESPALELLGRAVARLGPAYRRRGVDLMVDVEPQSFL